jgi:adenine/guanine phosphoribosyltransferase-like PRPP-binding protein
MAGDEQRAETLQERRKETQFAFDIPAPAGVERLGIMAGAALAPGLGVGCLSVRNSSC